MGARTNKHQWVGGNQYFSDEVQFGGAVILKSNTITATTDTADVSGVGILFVDKSAGSVTLGGLTGGVTGQVVHIVSTALANTLVIENQEGGTGAQDIHIGNGDLTLAATSGGVTVIFNGTYWVALQTSDVS